MVNKLPFFFNLKVHNEIETYLCQTNYWERQRSHPQRTEKKRQCQVKIFTPADAFSKEQGFLIHNFLTLQVMDSCFQIPCGEILQKTQMAIALAHVKI